MSVKKKMISLGNELKIKRNKKTAEKKTETAAQYIYVRIQIDHTLNAKRT